MFLGIERNIKQLVISLSIALLIFLTGCSGVNIEDVAVTPDGRILLVKESLNDLTTVMECIEIKSDPPELNCRSYKLNVID
jgi:PBP1b-binding outer membrane lipoprotein LpoB